jgi:hypothetical protein
MRARSQYDAATSVVASVINAWDPYSLLGGGAPRNEFDAEITRLVASIPRIHSAVDAANKIAEIFSAAFEPAYFTPAACADVGVQLFDRLQQAGLLSPREV